VTRFRNLHPGTEVALRLPRRLDLTKKVEIIVYRLIQECFNNISKYSSATHVNLSMDLADGVLSLHIEDDGVGFDVQQALERRDCYGLSGLRERVALLGGSLVVRSLRQGEVAEPRKGKVKPAPAEIGLTRHGTSIRIELPAAESTGDRPVPTKAVRKAASAGKSRGR
jgi:glucose-6-phosphate-specific signal transduction histidine kinase